MSSESVAPTVDSLCMYCTKTWSAELPPLCMPAVQAGQGRIHVWVNVPKDDVQQPDAADDSSAAAPVAAMAAPEVAAPAAAETPTAFKCATCGAFKDYQAQQCKKGCKPVKKVKTEAVDGAPPAKKTKTETPEVQAKPLPKVKLCTKQFGALFEELRSEEDEKKRDLVQAQTNLELVQLRIKMLTEIQVSMKSTSKFAADDAIDGGASDPTAASDPAAM